MTKTTLTLAQPEMKRLFELPLFSHEKFKPMLPGLSEEPLAAFVEAKTENSSTFQLTYYGISIAKATLHLSKGKYTWKI